MPRSVAGPSPGHRAHTAVCAYSGGMSDEQPPTPAAPRTRSGTIPNLRATIPAAQKTELRKLSVESGRDMGALISEALYEWFGFLQYPDQPESPLMRFRSEGGQL